MCIGSGAIVVVLEQLNEDEKSVSHLPLKKIEIQDGIILSQEYAGTANEDKKEDKKGDKKEF